MSAIPTRRDGHLGFVFPGQGSQSIGMLAELAGAASVVQETFEEASGVLGYDLWRLAQHGPESELNQTVRTQPLMLAAGVAVWRAWCQAGGPAPALMAGHSLGEYTALVCAGAMAFGPAVALVADRGRYMQEAVAEGEGAMAAILGLSDEQVVVACAAAAAGEVVSAVNFNAPGQVVIAGASSAVRRAVARAKELGAKRAVLLPVSVPSHCALMKGAAQRLAERLATVTVTAPVISVVNNVDVAQTSEPQAIRDALVRQLYSPVRWVEVVRHMASQGITTAVEAGPGKVLAGLSRRIEKSLVTFPVLDALGLRDALERVQGG